MFSRNPETRRATSPESKRRDEKAGRSSSRRVSSENPELFRRVLPAEFSLSGRVAQRDSARLYDFQVETLFLGSADTMRRQVLPYVADYVARVSRRERRKRRRRFERLGRGERNGAFLTGCAITDTAANYVRFRS